MSSTIQAGETIEYERSLYIHGAGEEVRRREDSHDGLEIFFEGQLRNQLGYSSQNSAHEAIDHATQRLRNQESFLTQEQLRRGSLHQQRVVQF